MGDFSSAMKLFKTATIIFSLISVGLSTKINQAPSDEEQKNSPRIKRAFRCSPGFYKYDGRCMALSGKTVIFNPTRGKNLVTPDWQKNKSGSRVATLFRGGLYNDQLFHLVSYGDYYEIQSVAYGLCLASHGESKYHGSPFLYNCGYNDQQWILEQKGSSNLWRIKNKQHGCYLFGNHETVNNSDGLVGCFGGSSYPDQYWEFQPESAHVNIG